MTNLNELFAALTDTAAFMREFKNLPIEKAGSAAGRNVILREAKRQYGVDVELSVDDRESMQEALLDYIDTGDIPHWDDDATDFGFPVSIHTPKGTSVKFFETVSYVNGQPVGSLSAAQIVSAIAAKEAEIESLSKLRNQPQAVKRAIAKIEADIAGVVALLDSLEPAA